MYQVFQDEQAVGTVEASREGLYILFSCRCQPVHREMIRLWMSCGEKETDLGLCVPMEGGFGTEKKIPARQCGTGIPEFILRHKDDTRRGRFIPLSPEEPFQYIHRLENAFLDKKNGQIGIRIQMSSSRPTGQWSEPMTSL